MSEVKILRSIRTQRTLAGRPEGVSRRTGLALQ